MNSWRAGPINFASRTRSERVRQSSFGPVSWYCAE